MNKIQFNLEHCFGITKFSQELSFEGENVVLIYAPNGLMKTSFAKTLLFYGQGKSDKVKDVVEDIAGNIDIKDEQGNIILPASVYVSNCEESDSETPKNITSFLADSILKQQYDDILRNLSEKQKALFKEISDYARSSDIISEFIRTFCEGKSSLFYRKFEELITEVNGDEIPYDFKYNSIFDKDGKVKAFIEANRSALKDYSDKYQSILHSSKLFKQNNGKTFGTYQASELSKSVADNTFFEVSHRIVLGDGVTTIDSSESLTGLISAELSSILTDGNVKKAFEKIDKKVGANDSLRQFKEIIENHPDLVDRLLDYDNFHKEVWKGYFAKLKNKADDLLTAYQASKPTLDSVLRQAAEQRTAWEKTISIFNRRFTVPFEVKIKNQTDLLLNEEAAALSFEYSTPSGLKEVESKVLEDVVLSKGELRAFYTLQLLFAIEKMKHDGGQDHILVFDDISDSFDYKNKYAIVEYLCDLKVEAGFKMIILTHNFDFYRTIASRLGVKRNSIYMAYKDGNNEIKLHKAEYLKEPFKLIKNNAQTPECFIALIPLVRNLIEYAKDTSIGTPKSDYLKLTSCLHVKTETTNLTVNDIEQIIRSNIDIRNLPTENTTSNIKDYIYSMADVLCVRPNLDEINIENKIVLAIAIRLKAEDYLISKLKLCMPNGDFDLFYNNIESNQTSVLTKKFNELCSSNNDIQLLIKEVNLITPENIHLNSFMFEPIIDMSVCRLKKLYIDAKTQLV
ncbi:MAG: hypothetical protein MJY71_00160 [Bacteroidaceae bacterium]|nr:hypothetical protein [Bacteroidaceae bacterium]